MGEKVWSQRQQLGWEGDRVTLIKPNCVANTAGSPRLGGWVGGDSSHKEPQPTTESNQNSLQNVSACGAFSLCGHRDLNKRGTFVNNWWDLLWSVYLLHWIWHLHSSEGLGTPINLLGSRINTAETYFVGCFITLQLFNWERENKACAWNSSAAHLPGSIKAHYLQRRWDMPGKKGATVDSWALWLYCATLQHAPSWRVAYRALNHYHNAMLLS